MRVGEQVLVRPVARAAGRAAPMQAAVGKAAPTRVAGLAAEAGDTLVVAPAPVVALMLGVVVPGTPVAPLIIKLEPGAS